MQSNPREARTLSQLRRQKAQKQRQTKNRLIVLSVFFLLTTTVLSFSFISFFESGFLVSEREPDTEQGSESTSPADSSEEQGSDSSTTPGTITPFVLPDTVEQTINTQPMQSPSYKMLSLPENGTVDISYFNDVTFIGDSLAQGFVEVYSTFPDSGSVAFKSMSSDGFVTKLVEDAEGNSVSPIELVANNNPKKVYILIGVNDLVWMSDDQMVASFGMLIDALGQRIPGLQIYLLSVPPQTASRGTDERYSVARINGLNDRLAVMAIEKNAYFVDLHEILADEAGNLKEDIAAGDGFHITPQGYLMIRDYLMTHTVHTPSNPYVEGSPLYSIADPAVITTTEETAS